MTPTHYDKNYEHEREIHTLTLRPFIIYSKP